MYIRTYEKFSKNVYINVYVGKTQKFPKKTQRIRNVYVGKGKILGKFPAAAWQRQAFLPERIRKGKIFLCKKNVYVRVYEGRGARNRTPFLYTKMYVRGGEKTYT